MTAVIDLGATHATFTLTHQRVVAYERRIPDFSIAAIRETIETQLRLDDEMIEHAITQIGLLRRQDDGAGPDAGEIQGIIVRHVDRLVEELNVSVSYARHRYPDAQMSQLILAGGGAAMPGLGEHIAEQLDIDTRALAPSDLIDVRPGVDKASQSPALTAALGLALHGTGS
jgi:Tfp pilus assembly PilM family ATPase